jgi:hypothetical protein
MRIAFDAVLADLRFTSPDVIFHGGDLAGGGANSAAIIDQVRGLGWQGVVGNMDECLFGPSRLLILRSIAGPANHVRSDPGNGGRNP